MEQNICIHKLKTMPEDRFAKEGFSKQKTIKRHF
jgi:hypothetical protein